MIMSITVCKGQYVKIDILENEYRLHRTADTIQVQILLNLSKAYEAINVTHALKVATTAYQLAERLGSYNQQFELLHQQWSYQMKTGLLKESLSTMEMCMKLIRLGDNKKAALTIARLGVSSNLLGRHVEALSHLMNAINKFRVYNDRKHLAEFTLTAGSSCFELGKIDSALQLYMDAILLASDDSLMVNNVYVKLAELCQHLGQNSQAIEYLNKVIRWGEFHKQYSYVYAAVLMSANVNLSTNKVQLAESQYSRALNYFQKIGDMDLAVECMIGLANVGVMQADPNIALPFLEKALPIALHNNKFSQLIRINSCLSIMYEQFEDFSQASSYQALSSSYQDSLNSNQDGRDMKAVGELLNQNRSEFIRYQQHTTRIESLIWIVIAIGMLILAIVICWSWFTNRALKNKSEQITANQIRLQLRKRTLDFQNLRLETDLYHCSEELTFYSVNLGKRDQFLDSIKTDIDKMKRDAPSNIPIRLNQLVGMIGDSIDGWDDDWKSFDYYFEKVHEGFFDHARAIAPDLSDFELRLCALIKLNFETKEISTMLDMTNEGANVAKHRLRKKLNIAMDDNLVAFFNSL